MTTDELAWYVAPFHELDAQDVHDVLRLRQEVFVVEQDCVFPEIDGRDPAALHLLGRIGASLVAYARIFPPSGAVAHASIGRVVTAPPVRGRGMGRALMHRALGVAAEVAPDAEVRVAAQAHLEEFYESLGFRRVGESYLEDGIRHVDMVHRR